VSGDNNDYAGAVKATQWERAPSISATRPTTPNRDWAELVLTEMEVFPKGRYDDLTDSKSWSRKFGQRDRWSFRLMAGTLCPSNQERL
jgi:hypothetical protein